MNRKALLAATSLSLFAVLGAGLAGAAPGGSYTLTCAAGGDTSATWRHAKLDHVSFAWSDDAATVYPGAVVPALFKPPHGFVSTTTPRSGAGLRPTHVTASFERADGSGADQVEADCG